MNNSSFKQLAIWQKGMDIVEEIYKLLILLPVEERFALCDQMRRCSVSIPSILPKAIDAIQIKNSCISFPSPVAQLRN